MRHQISFPLAIILLSSLYSISAFADPPRYYYPNDDRYCRGNYCDDYYYYDDDRRTSCPFVTDVASTSRGRWPERCVEFIDSCNEFVIRSTCRYPITITDTDCLTRHDGQKCTYVLDRVNPSINVQVPRVEPGAIVEQYWTWEDDRERGEFVLKTTGRQRDVYETVYACSMTGSEKDPLSATGDFLLLSVAIGCAYLSTRRRQVS